MYTCHFTVNYWGPYCLIQTQFLVPKIKRCSLFFHERAPNR